MQAMVVCVVWARHEAVGCQPPEAVRFESSLIWEAGQTGNPSVQLGPLLQTFPQLVMAGYWAGAARLQSLGCNVSSTCSPHSCVVCADIRCACVPACTVLLAPCCRASLAPPACRASAGYPRLVRCCSTCHTASSPRSRSAKTPTGGGPAIWLGSLPSSHGRVGVFVGPGRRLCNVPSRSSVDTV